jgi:TonB family protein
LAGEPKRRGAPWISSAVLFVLVAAATFLVLYARGVRSGNGIVVPRIVRAIFPAAGLGLRVEGQGDRLLLSWNRRSPSVLAAREGVLVIDDGGQQRQVHLSSDQLADGSVLYRPTSDDILFRLETRAGQGATTIESLRVLDGGKPAHAGFPASTPEAAAPPQASDKTVDARQPPPQPLARFVAARPDRQVLPDLSDTGSEMLDAPPEVDVQVHVDANGHVGQAHVLTGGVSPLLARAVIAAAEKWTFLPATRGGKAVESEHTIIFQFQPDKY